MTLNKMKGNRHSRYMTLKNLQMVICFLSIHVLMAQSYDITEYGAMGDGIKDNTTIIQKLIDRCSTSGGTVLIPKGVFLTSTLILKDNTHLHLSQGSELRGSTNPNDYPLLNAGISFYGEGWAKQALIFAKDVNNIQISGKGTINGQGEAFKINTNKKPERYKNRPYLLWFSNSKNITVRDIELKNSAFWMQHYLGCENVTLDGLRIWNHSNKNNDMMDIDGCKNVTISNIIGDSDDDGITLKSTSPLISEYITITNCIISSHCNGLKMGTESTGGFRNVVISNCIIRPSRSKTNIYGLPEGISGISLEMVDGGIMENISINNVVIDGPEVPLFIRLGNRARKHNAAATTPGLGKIRNIRISNITATGAGETGSSITGISGAAVENVSLHNIDIMVSKTGESELAADQVPVMENAYPEATMFGKLPAYGFFIRNVKQLQMSNVNIRHTDKDPRPGIRIDNTEAFSLFGLNLQSDSNTKNVVDVRQSTNGWIQSNHQYPAVHYLVQDKDSKNIELQGDFPFLTSKNKNR
ncbi:glycoside hydrolase family 28 protein [Maribacter polysiphoniae]|uniref:glycoside hydrolase family 28 protein n=1 Tax=Maribacter polysiphoniae TaxID=429344 RepID=UPI002355CA7E|nr:glycosyl hydrolase family 28 protein [Maribacter polysiphoniae]